MVRRRVASKATRQPEANKFLSNVPEEFVFRCSDGRILRNMEELADALKSMNEGTFAYHANVAKNDFATWVYDIIKDAQLAEALRQAQTRTQAAQVVTDRISSLGKR